MGNYALVAFLFMFGLMLLGLAIPEAIIGGIALIAGIFLLIGR